VIKILFTIILLLISSSVHAYEWQILRVIDGDTIEIKNECFPTELKLSVRVLGIDTPEKGSRAKCEREAKLAEKASKFTKQFIGKNKTATFKNIQWDKYGGRLLADVEINGKSLAGELVKNNYARLYDGKKKGSWCE
jgi:endonuclease YncB( thermonuclease family)